MKDHGVKEDSLSEVQNATSAEEIDEIRKRNNIAYEYLCHLEEAKMWLEAVLREKLPPTTELEESLRHGVYLAKLGHFIAPEVVPVSKIYDLQLQRYNVAGLQFCHTDNINYWLKALVISGLPKTFHPETTDVYDKKGMPKVIYCLHALSTHLFKMGRAPFIQALYGKINFTDDEISNMKQALEDNGIPMPAFQKIGGLLLEDLTDDTRALHDDTEMLLHALENQVAKLHDVKPSYIKHYWNVLRDAKILKVKAAMNRVRQLRLELNQNKYDKQKLKLKCSNTIAEEKEKLARECHVKLKEKEEQLKSEMYIRDEKLRKMQEVLNERYPSGTVPSSIAVLSPIQPSVNSVCPPASNSVGELHLPSVGVLNSAGKYSVTPRSRPGSTATTPHRCRRSSCSDMWFDHRSAMPTQLNTVLQPKMKKRKSVTKLTDVTDIADPKVSKYCLMTQEQDTDGELKTRLYKISHRCPKGQGRCQHCTRGHRELCCVATDWRPTALKKAAT